MTVAMGPASGSAGRLRRLTVLWACTVAALAGTTDHAGALPLPRPCIPGIPSTDWCGDGGPALAARLASPGALAVLPGGGFAIADMANGMIREVDAAGTIRTLAFVGWAPSPPYWGGCHLGQLARLPDGRLLVAAPYCGRVYAITQAGEVTTFAGTKSAFWYGPRGEGGPAARARLYAPTGLAVAPDGTVLIADLEVIRRVTPDGILHTLRLTPRFGPAALALSPDGSLLASDFGRGIWRIDPATGHARRIAGRRRAGGSTAEGVPATQARLRATAGLAATPDGGFVFADWSADRVRRVSPAGTIATVAGSGVAGFDGDGGPPRDARLSEPVAVALRDDGSLLIADTGNDRVRVVSADGTTIATVAGGGRPKPPIRAEFEPGIFAPCLGGCGGSTYSPLWSYFYLTHLPLRSVAGAPFDVHFVTTRRVRARVDVFHRRHIVSSSRYVVPAGSVTFSMPGLRAGRYWVRLRGRSGDRQAQDSAPLRIH